MGTINGTDSDKMFIMQHLKDDVAQLALTKKKICRNRLEFRPKTDCFATTCKE